MSSRVLDPQLLAAAMRKRRKPVEIRVPPPLVATGEERDRQRALFDRHDRPVVTIRLPLAPSVDHFVIPAWKTKRFIYTSEARAYREAVGVAWLARWNGFPPEPLSGRLRVLVVIHFARNGRADVANREKALMDGLTACGAWLDDSQIDDLRLLRGPVMPGIGAMDVTIETIGE